MRVMEGSFDAPGARSNHAWYALHTRYQHEKVVAQILTHKGFEIFLPLYSAVHQWRDRARELSLPLFPCYVFLKGGLDRRHDILTTPGIIGWAGIGAAPSPIPDEEMETVRRVVNQRTNVEPHPYLTHGDRVRVKSGALAGVEGILVRKKNLCRLVLSVEILQRSAAVEVDAFSVERVTASAPTGLRSGWGAAWAPYHSTPAKSIAPGPRIAG